MRTLTIALIATLLTSGCAAHVHARYPTFEAYRNAHPNARFILVHKKPMPHRTCWKVPGGWRCLVR